MSKKKERERLLRLQQEEAQRQQEMANAPRGPRATFRVMNNNGPVPIARPSDFIQLTPVVQPMAMVPYSTQSQPLAMFDDEENY